MKTNRLSVLRAAIMLFGATIALANVSLAAESKASAPKTTTKTSLIGPATEQVVVTQKYKDGTVIRVVQILHQDGTAETSGERQAPATKS